MAPPTNFGKMLEAFEAFSEHFRGRVDRLERRVAVDETNTQIRLRNSHHAQTPQRALQPLHSVVTAEVIPDFPRTPYEVSRVNDGQADFLLEQLGLPREGTLDDKRRALLLSCGVVVLHSETWEKAQRWRVQGAGMGV